MSRKKNPQGLDLLSDSWQPICPGGSVHGRLKKDVGVKLGNVHDIYKTLYICTYIYSNSMMICLYIHIYIIIVKKTYVYQVSKIPNYRF